MMPACSAAAAGEKRFAMFLLVIRKNNDVALVDGNIPPWVITMLDNAYCKDGYRFVEPGSPEADDAIGIYASKGGPLKVEDKVRMNGVPVVRPEPVAA